MVEYITVMPPEDADDKRNFKFPFVVCELFSCEVPSLLDRFFTNTEHLSEACKILNTEEINFTLSGYFSKLMASLLNRNSSETLKFLFESGYSAFLISHLYNRSISDLLLKIFTLTDSPAELYKPERIKLFTSLVEKLLDSQNSASAYHAAIICNDILNRGLESGICKDYILSLMQKKTVERLLANIFSAAPNDACLLYLKNLLTNSAFKEYLKLWNDGQASEEVASDEDSTVCMGQDEEAQDNLVAYLQSYISKIVALLKQPNNNLIASTFGESIEPMGKVKLELLEILNALIKLNNRQLLIEIGRHNVMEIVVDLFFKYKWNSILHNLFESMVQAVLATDYVELHTALLESAGLIEKIVFVGLNSNYDSS
jgi:serine/threonine-protein phosphatase 6 regulatory subunit 3